MSLKNVTYLSATYTRINERFPGGEELINIFVYPTDHEIDVNDTIPLTSEEKADISNIVVALQGLLI